MLQEEMARFLMDSGADVNRRQSRGMTALWWAAKEGRLAAVKALVEGGADVNIKGELEESPLQVAERCGHREVAAFLREHGAKE